MPKRNDGYYQNAIHQIREGQSNLSNQAPVTRQIEGAIPRQIPEVDPPATNKLTEDEFFLTDSTGRRRPNPAVIKNYFLHEGRLTEPQALFILDEATHVLSKEKNLLELEGPITVCGDIHGQYYDLMKLFEIGGSLSENSYLFLGDYVDRGQFGIECLLYLYTLKISFPDRIFLLRGNHECRHLTEYFTFRLECFRKYSQVIYDNCIKSFCALPIAAILDGRFFCVHGGISPYLIEVSDINSKVNRFQEPPAQGLFCDLLWADPIPNFGHEQEMGPNGPGLDPSVSFVDNPARGCSFYFTFEATCKFLERNKLLGVIRGHEAQDTGYTMHRKTPLKKFPSVITIFSAPNYCDAYRNRGAVLKYINRNITIRQFNSSPHPYWLPNFMDAFTWSLPFVGAKIVESLIVILSCCTEEELEESTSEEEIQVPKKGLTPEVKRRREDIKAKILAVGKMKRFFEALREGSELGSELHIENGEFDRSNYLGVQDNRIQRELKGVQTKERFDMVRGFDKDNERIPQLPQTVMGFPQAQAPSTRLRRAGSMDDTESIRRKVEEGDDPLIQSIAERFARMRAPERSSQILKRHGTA